MIIINVSQPLTILLLLTIAVLLIFLGKEIQKPQIAAVMLIVFLAFVLMHSIQLNMVNDVSTEYTTLLKCIPIDLAFVLLYFLAYLWVDQISCEALKKKNLDNSLDWFWKNI